MFHFNKLFENHSDLKTPRSRKCRSRVSRVLCGFAIVLIGVGVVFTGVCIWNNYHTTKTTDVHDNAWAIEQQVLDNVGNDNLKDLSGDKPTPITKANLSVGKNQTDAIVQKNNTRVSILETGYVNEKSSYKKLLTKKQKASDVMYVQVCLKNTGDSSLSYQNLFPTMLISTNEILKKDKNYEDGKVVYPGYSVYGDIFVGQKSLSSCSDKKLSAGKAVTAVYLFDIAGHRKDKHQKQLSVYVVQNDKKVLTHQYTIKE